MFLLDFLHSAGALPAPQFYGPQALFPSLLRRLPGGVVNLSKILLLSSPDELRSGSTSPGELENLDLEDQSPPATPGERTLPDWTREFALYSNLAKKPALQKRSRPDSASLLRNILKRQVTNRILNLSNITGR